MPTIPEIYLTGRAAHEINDEPGADQDRDRARRRLEEEQHRDEAGDDRERQKPD